MKDETLLIILVIIILIAVIAFSWDKGVYNDLVAQDETVKTAWSPVENQHQRRSDLIPDLAVNDDCKSGGGASSRF